MILFRKSSYQQFQNKKVQLMQKMIQILPNMEIRPQAHGMIE